MITLHEYKRTYYFPLSDGTTFELNVHSVRHLKVSSSGGHRLTKRDGTLVYVPTGWVCIVIDSDRGWEQ